MSPRNGTHVSIIYNFRRFYLCNLLTSINGVYILASLIERTQAEKDMENAAYRIEKFTADHVSWKTGVSPREVARWAIVRKADGKRVDSYATKKLAERALAYSWK